MTNLLKKNHLAEETINEPIKEESQKCRVEIDQFVDGLKNFIINIKQSVIYNYTTGALEAQKKLQAIQTQRDSNQ